LIEISYSNKCAIHTQKFIAPVQVFSLHRDLKTNKLQPVYCVDVTDHGLGVSCSSEGSLLIWLTENGMVRRNLDGHVFDVQICKFFPSGVVVLSGGADFRLKIWSAEDASCPVTLITHTKGFSFYSIVYLGPLLDSSIEYKRNN
jgi:proteasomal ATPase-associated factor 1